MTHRERKPSLALVTGATGALGPSIVWALQAAGYRVRTFSLDAPAPGSLPESVENRLGDITDPSAVQSAVAGAEVVLHMAALLHLVDPPPGLRQAYESVNIQGTECVVDASLAEEVRRLVFFSTIAVYGYGAGRTLDELTAPQPHTFYAKTKLVGEGVVLSAKRSDGQPLGTVLRLAAVYGARVKGNYRRLVGALARRRFVPVGAGKNRRTLICDMDVARAALLAAEHPAAAGKIYNVTDGQYHTVAEINAAVCAALGRRSPRLYIPIGPARIVAGLLEDIARRAGRRPIVGRNTVDKYVEDVAVQGRRFQEELGFCPEYDLRSGWRDAVERMRATGDL